MSVHSPVVAEGSTSLAEEILTAAAGAAADVDHQARFPREAFEALRKHGLLGALVPKSLGGLGHSLQDVAAQCQALAGVCGNAGMVLAMHHIQVASLVRHAKTQPWHARFIERVCADQLLLASATSEADVGGSMRTSICAVEAGEDERFNVEKKATAISYALDADAILLTARASEQAVQGDQVLLVIERDGLDLQPMAAWDAMGMRGTGSGAFLIRGEGLTAQIFQTPFSEVAAASMVPISHILWGAVWTGIAGDAVLRARSALRARLKPGAAEMPVGTNRLVDAVEALQLAEARVKRAIDELEWDTPCSGGFAQAASHNLLKTGVSELCLTAAQHALAICGFAGYAREGSLSVSRHVRDLHSAPLMIGNGRMRDNAARLILAQRPILGLGK